MATSPQHVSQSSMTLNGEIDAYNIALSALVIAQFTRTDELTNASNPAR
jgi:hypothetical protein